MAENKENPDNKNNNEPQNTPTNSLINIISEQNIIKDGVPSSSDPRCRMFPKTIISQV